MQNEEIQAAIEELLQHVPDARPAFEPGKTPIPASGKVVGKEEKALMVEAALDGWLTTGRFNDAFEAALGDFLGAKHVLTVNSGSSANLVAFSALTSPRWGKRAIRPGDEVITAAAGFPTTIAPIMQFGAIPVFVDVDADTWNVDVDAVARAITPRTKAVMLAHTLGIPFDAERLAALCRERGIWLVEDCCDALGARWNGRLTGSFGDIATLSFYPAHHITTGEGGAVFTSNDELAQVAESFRDWGRHCHCRPGQDNACGRRYSGQYGELPEGYDHKYVYAHAGYNLKMTDLTAACGLAQMRRLPGFIEKRKQNYAYLHNGLAGCAHLRFPVTPEQADPSWFGLPVILKESAPCSRVDFLKALNRRRIGTRLMFAGNAVRQPFMEGRPYRVADVLTQTDLIMERGLWLGVWPGLSQEMLDYVIGSVQAILSA